MLEIAKEKNKIINKKRHIIVLKNIAGQCINETKVQAFYFDANINFCKALQRFQYIHDT